MLGGVCSGIGIYFNIDPLWVRLLFVVLALAPGIGILAYLILWIVVPEAATTAEKLEMRGEPINVSNIEKSIRKEVDKLKDTINELTDDAKSTFKKKKQ
jgi:phage shock protein PspC (stress-responsive transcriptional regulator)